MRRRIAYTATWFLMMSVGVASAAPGPNLLVNGGAETGDLTGWRLRSTTEATYPPPGLTVNLAAYAPQPPNRAGQHRFGVQADYNFVGFFQYQTVNVVPGRLYEAGFSAVQYDGSDQLLALYWYDGEATPGFNPVDTPLDGLATTDRYGLVYGAPHGEAYMQWRDFVGVPFRPSSDKVTLALYYRHIWQSGVCVWHVDEIFLREVDADAPAATPTPGGVSPGNLLRNPGAETGDLAGWSAMGNVYPRVDVVVSQHMPTPLNFAGNHRFGWFSEYVNNQRGFLYQVVDTIPGRAYELRLQFAQFDGSDEYLSLYIAHGGINEPWQLLAGGGAGPYPVWRPLAAEFTAQAARSTVIIHFEHIWGSRKAVFHVDNIELIDLQAPTPTPAGRAVLGVR